MRMLVLLFLIVTSCLAHADQVIYKWADQDGNLHFSDCPPELEEECHVEEVAVPSGPTLSKEELKRISERRTQLMRELDERARQREKQKEQRQEHRAVQDRQDEFRARQCALARSNLEELFKESPVYRLGDRSRAVLQREDETLKDVETMRDLVDQYCDD